MSKTYTNEQSLLDARLIFEDVFDPDMLGRMHARGIIKQIAGFRAATEAGISEFIDGIVSRETKALRLEIERLSALVQLGHKVITQQEPEPHGEAEMAELNRFLQEASKL